MAAYFNQGFSVRKPMWHGLGEVLDAYPGREEAMRIAGHDFTVVERAVEVVGTQGNKRLPNYKALVKSGTGEVFNVVPASYTVVQNDLMWDIADALANTPNMKYETAGILKDGAVLWVLAWLDEPTQVTGDDSAVYPWVCVSTTHDGSGALQAGAFSIRTVCWNTYSAGTAQSKAAGLHYTFRHTKNVKARIDEAKQAIKGMRVEHDEFMKLSEDLARITLSEAQRELFVSNLIPMPEQALISDRVRGNVEEARTSVRQILNSKTTPEAHRFTGYGAFQAGIEYLDHARGARNADTKFGRSLLRQESAKNKLLTLVKECAAA